MQLQVQIIVSFHKKGLKSKVENYSDVSQIRENYNSVYPINP
jgi:hypothetical protein